MGDFFNMNFGSGQQPDWNWDPAAGGSDSRAVSLRGASIDEIRRQRAKIQMEGYQWMAAVQDLLFQQQMMMQQKLMALQKLELEQGILASSDTSLIKFPPPQGKIINWLETSPDWKEDDTFQRMGKL